jgi:uncharacterized protein YpmS
MKAYKIGRWVVLIALVLLLGLIFIKPTRIVEQQPPTFKKDNAEAFQTKLVELEQAHARGEGGAEIRVSADEVGAALAASSAQAVLVQTAAEDSVKPEQVPIKDPQVRFEGDEVKGQFATEVYGREVYVTLSGRLGTKDGYVTFSPTGFKIGSLPVPISLVEAQVRNKLEEPENREKLKLPDFVSDLRIENGQLVIAEK